tara:strand:+ start:432 stop:743 length:312 start_codon:yes stop_codon:yes gene_type:complete
MIIFTIRIQDGERQYTEWGYYETFTIEQYECGELPDQEILSEFYNIQFEDTDIIGYDFETSEEPITAFLSSNGESYWVGDTSVEIDLVKEITPEHLEIIKRYL